MSKDKSRDVSDSEAPERLMFGWYNKDTPRKHRDIHHWSAVLTIVLAVPVVIGFLLSAYNWATTKPTPPFKKYRVMVPLQANSSEYSAFMQTEGPDATFEGRYTNKASQNIREIVKAAKKQWFADPNVNRAALPTSDDIDFFSFPEGHEGEKESYERAFHHAIKAAKDAQREVIAVLGNVSSTSTLKYGEFCGKYKLPMILPLATATNLLHELGVRKVPAVLRLPPPNDKQAKAVSDFLLQRDIQQTVVIKDLTNDAWSRDLVDNFRENYVQRPLSDQEARKAGKFGQIISVVPVGGPETQPFIYPILSGSEQDALLVIGMTNASVETLTQAKASKANFTYTILTDGAVDEYLDTQIISIQGKESLHNLYLSFPVPCVLPEALKSYIDVEAGLKVADFKMTHALYVADGAFIIMSMLNNGLKDNADASGRQIIVDAINKLKSDAKQSEDERMARGEPQRDPVGQLIILPLPFNSSENRKYVIDKTGNNTNASYYLFNIVAGSSAGRTAIDWKRAKGSSSPLKCSEDTSDGTTARTQ